MDVQSGIAGKTAMFSVLAWQGRLIGGFRGVRLAKISLYGPSTAVRLAHDQSMADAAGKLVAALGLTGFVSFDFMIPDDGGEPVVIECNPRPVPVHHLGRHIGADLAAAFARLVKGETLEGGPLFAKSDLDVVLFPHALNPAQHHPDRMLDMPHDDPGLIRHVVGHVPPEGAVRPVGLAA